MKKIISLIAIALFIGVFATVSFATEDVLSTGDGTTGVIGDGELNIGKTTGSILLNIGLSPKVVARYVSSVGTSDAEAQWYSIGTVHPGGNIMYGTAQDLNNIYHKPYGTGTAVTKTLLNISAVKASPVVWTNASWVL